MTVIGDLPDQSEATGGRHGFGGASPVGLNSGGASPVQPPEIPGQILQVRKHFSLYSTGTSKLFECGGGGVRKIGVYFFSLKIPVNFIIRMAFRII